MVFSDVKKLGDAIKLLGTDSSFKDDHMQLLRFFVCIAFFGVNGTNIATVRVLLTGNRPPRKQSVQ